MFLSIYYFNNSFVSLAIINSSFVGITNEETIENVTVSKEGEEYKITGEMVFDRTRYDAKFQMTVQDMVLSDDISLDIELIAS